METRQHGISKRRTWRKLHLGVDESTEEILAAVVTTNNFHDSEILLGLLGATDADIKQLGVYHWLVLALIALVLEHWGYLWLRPGTLPDWQQAAQAIVENCLDDVVVALLLAQLERRQSLLEGRGWQVQITRYKI